MNDLSEDVAYVIMLNGGKLVGKTRLQKIFYLLEAKKVGYGIDFDYVHFGPFSAELAQGAEDATSAGLIDAESKLGYHEVPYVIYELKNFDEKKPGGKLDKERLRAIEIMKGYSALELEIAATAVYLRENGFSDNFIEELKIRKPQKATPERINKAQSLIRSLAV